MLRITNNLKKKERQMEKIVPILTLALTLLNLGLVTVALTRLGGLRKDLRTPVVKKFNAEFKRKTVDIPKAPENFGKQRDEKHSRGNREQSAQNRTKSSSQNRPVQVRRPVAKAPDVFSNEPAPQASAVPPRPVAPEPVTEGRRPLPPRFNAGVVAGTAPAELAPLAPAPVAPVVVNDAEETGMEFDRSKMAHGRRNVVAKPVIDDSEEV